MSLHLKPKIILIANFTITWNNLYLYCNIVLNYIYLYIHIYTCSKNSALLQASSGESIFVGFNSQLCLLSINFTMVSRSAAFKKEVHTDFIYKSIKVVVRLAALKSVGVSSSLST